MRIPTEPVVAQDRVRAINQCLLSEDQRCVEISASVLTSRALDVELRQSDARPCDRRVRADAPHEACF